MASYKGVTIPPGSTQAQIMAIMAQVDAAASPAAAPAVTTPTTTKPKATTSQVYQNVNVSPYDSSTDKALTTAIKNSSSNANMKIDEKAIYNSQLKRYQAEIDATNKIFGEQLVSTQQTGLGNLGTTTVINARSGTLGSPSGEAIYKGTQNENLQAEGLVRANQALAVQAILGKAKQSALDEVAAKREAQSKGTTDYLKYLADQTERKKTNVAALASTIYKQKIDPKSIDPKQIKALAKTYGVGTQDIFDAYDELTKEDRDKEAAVSRENTILSLYRQGIKDPETIADYVNFDDQGNQVGDISLDEIVGLLEKVKKNVDPVSLGKGARLVNPETGEVIAEGASDSEGFNLSKGEVRWERDANGNWTQIASGGGADTDPGKIVKVNGTDYIQNADGSLTEPQVPNASTPQVKVEKANEVVSSIDAILNNPNLSKAIGPRSSQIPEWLRSGTRNDVDAAIKKLIAGIAIENLGLLKGPMSDKDVAFIKEASSGLSTNMSEQGFKDQLNALKAKFEEIKTKAASGQGAEATAPSTYVGNDGKQYRQRDDGNWEEVAFNEGGATRNALEIATAIKKVESGGNYTAKGGSTENGAYQFMPSTWKQWAGEILGDPNAPMTAENQDAVAINKVQQLLDQGHSPGDIALIWNGGTPKVKKGVNKYGVAYDSGAYANRVLNQLYA